MLCYSSNLELLIHGQNSSIKKKLCKTIHILFLHFCPCNVFETCTYDWYSATYVLLLQNDLDRVVDQLHAASASQQSLQDQLDIIRSDRDSLLEELRRSAVGLHSNRFHSVLAVFVSDTSLLLISTFGHFFQKNIQRFSFRVSLN